MYQDNFWEFSRKLFKRELDQDPKKPTFDKKTADNSYPKVYYTVPDFDPSSLNWFPFLRISPTPVAFSLIPVKPNDIKHILCGKKRPLHLDLMDLNTEYWNISLLLIISWQRYTAASYLTARHHQTYGNAAMFH